MKILAIFGLVSACLLGAAGLAQAQAVQQYSYPPQDGSKSPPSTLRITEQGQAGAPAGVIRDTPDSLEQYRSCRRRSDQAAVDNEQLQSGVAGCLKALEARRQP